MIVQYHNNYYFKNQQKLIFFINKWVRKLLNDIKSFKNEQKQKKQLRTQLLLYTK